MLAPKSEITQLSLPRDDFKKCLDRIKQFKTKEELTEKELRETVFKEINQLTDLIANSIIKNIESASKSQIDYGYLMTRPDPKFSDIGFKYDVDQVLTQMYRWCKEYNLEHLFEVDLRDYLCKIYEDAIKNINKVYNGLSDGPEGKVIDYDDETFSQKIIKDGCIEIYLNL